MSKKAAVVRVLAGGAMAMLVAFSSLGTMAPDAALAKKKSKSSPTVTDVVVCQVPHKIRKGKIPAGTHGVTLTLKSDDKALKKNAKKLLKGTCASLGVLEP